MSSKNEFADQGCIVFQCPLEIESPRAKIVSAFGWRVGSPYIRLAGLTRTRLRACRLQIPYGMWTLADGTRVLFNREYTPIWKRKNDVTSSVNPSWRVPYVKQEWFFTDRDTPWLGTLKHHRAACERCQRILAEFEVGVAR